jgi:hypothetical protein
VSGDGDDGEEVPTDASTGDSSAESRTSVDLGGSVGSVGSACQLRAVTVVCGASPEWSRKSG